MLFPTHVAAGYLLGRRFTNAPALAALGAALPDLLDKPLGAVGATALYQSVGHSVLTLLCLSLAWLAARRAGPLGGWLPAVALGWASHLALDVLGIALNGRPENWVLLLWPLLGKPNPSGLDPVAFSVAYLWSPSFYLEVAVWIAVAFVAARSVPLRSTLRRSRR